MREILGEFKRFGYMVPESTFTNSTQVVCNSLCKLLNWIETNGLASYDPYDVHGATALSSLYRLSASHARLFPLRVGAAALPYLFPKLTRKALLVPKSLHPKTFALLSRACFNLYAITRKEDYLKTGLELVEAMKGLATKGHSSLCWGIPFDWHSFVFIPRTTPCATVSALCAQAICDAYDLTGNRVFREDMIKCASFFLNELNVMRSKEEHVYFSYTPIDHMIVHNSNLWIASALARISQSCDMQCQDIIRDLVQGVLDDQNPDGSFWYFQSEYARRNRIANSIDNFHTGYDIELLFELKRLGVDVPAGKIVSAAVFYIDSLFSDNFIPKPTANNQRTWYTVDIHDCAQAIITLPEVSALAPQLAIRVTQWTIRNMQDPQGYFYYRRYLWGIDKTPYLRWSQAWMAYALSRLLYLVWNSEVSLPEQASLGSQLQAQCHFDPQIPTGNLDNDWSKQAADR